MWLILYLYYIRTDYYEKPDLAAEVMMAIKHQKVDNIAYAAYGDNPEDNEQNDSAYQIVSVQDVLAHPAELYQYPVESMEFPKVKDTTSIPRGLLLNRYSRRAG